MSANDAVGLGAVPIGLANGAAIKKPVKDGETVTWDDLILNTSLTEAVAYKARLKMEAKFAAGISRIEPLT